MLTKKLLCLIVIICFAAIGIPAFSAKPTPPRNTLVFSKVFENIVDNSWSNLEFPKNIQPPGLYYMELTEVIGTVGCWGSKQDPYPDGPNKEVLTAWKNDAPDEDGKADLRLQYRLLSNNWVELIVIAAQGAIVDTWWPFPLHGSTSIGQTFLALDDFNGVGLQTPTWNTASSGCTITLYSAEGAKYPVESIGKLSAKWGEIKSRF